MQLIVSEGHFSAIHFAAGDLRDGGSCEFATEACKIECGVGKNLFTQAVFAAFKAAPAISLIVQINAEMREAGTKVLHWFSSGDCPSDMVDKIFEVIMGLKDLGVIQLGFTRNRKLWDRLNVAGFSPFALSVEDKEKAIKLSHKGLIGVPAYRSWKVNLYYKGECLTEATREKYGGGCGAGFVVIGPEAEDVYPDDCQLCYDERRGCFKVLEDQGGYDEVDEE